LIARPEIIVTGTARYPSATSASYADWSSSTFLTANARRSRESNSFTCSQARQWEPVYTMMSSAMHQFYAA